MPTSHGKYIIDNTGNFVIDNNNAFVLSSLFTFLIRAIKIKTRIKNYIIQKIKIKEYIR